MIWPIAWQEDIDANSACNDLHVSLVRRELTPVVRQPGEV